MSLVVVLLILIVVSILGVGAAQMALSGERASRYDRDYQVAWQSADSGISDATDDISGHGSNAALSRASLFVADDAGTEFSPGCVAPDTRHAGMCKKASDEETPAWQTVDFLASGDSALANGTNATYTVAGQFTGRAFAAGSVGIQPAHAPRYVIENMPGAGAEGMSAKIGDAREFSFHRITAVGFGPNQDTQVALQAIYQKAE